jgi:uncharacterized membrane protein
MKLHIAVLAAGLALAPAPARAAVTFEWLFDGAFPNAVSYDGTVIAGNMASDYSQFRWTAATGIVRLERSSLALIGNTGGKPGISYDGTRISGTIANDDTTYTTSGLWTLGQGWQQICPPAPPTAGVMDEALSDVWGLSGDGTTVVGLFWRMGYHDGSAHAYRWRSNTDMVDLDTTPGSSRANNADYSGNLVVGWDSHPQYGYWRPAVWQGTTMTLLGGYDAMGEATAASPNGEWVGGFEKNAASVTREAARWHWNGSAWSATQYLGVVPGTAPDQGLAATRAISADGKLVIGYNSFYGDPFETTGFIWTDSTGCQDIEFWLAEYDIAMPDTFDIRDLIAMTPDGRTLLGFGTTTTLPYTWKAFAIHLDRQVTGVEPPQAASALQLSASPNPARLGASFVLALPNAGRAELSLYDASGRRIRTLVSSELAAGRHTIAWDGRDQSGARVGAGMYFMRLQVGAQHTGGKIVVVE